MIIVSNTVADSDGQVLIRDWNPGHEYDSTARISKVKTLDGSVALSHYGVSALDRELSVRLRVTADEFQILKTFHEDAMLLRISTWEGTYTGYIYHLKSMRDGRTTVVFYFNAQLA